MNIEVDLPDISGSSLVKTEITVISKQISTELFPMQCKVQITLFIKAIPNVRNCIDSKAVLKV